MSESRSKFRVSKGRKLSLSSFGSGPLPDSQIVSRLKQAKKTGQDTASHQRLNILLAGLSGTGKSSTANRIFGAALCPVGLGASVTSVPNICQAVIKQDGVDFTLTIVDSPGLKDTRGRKQDIENLANTKALLQRPEYKPDIVLITFDATNTRLSGEALREPILSLKKTFESLIDWRMVVVLFTRADSYASHTPFKKHMASVTKAVQDVISEATGVSNVPCMAAENAPAEAWEKKVKAQGVDWIKELTVNTMAEMLKAPFSIKDRILAMMIEQGPSLQPVRMPEEDVKLLLDRVKVDNFKIDVSDALEAVRKALQPKESGLARWLDEHHLGQYAAAFDEQGYMELADVRTNFTEEKLVKQMRMLPGHASKMARHLSLPDPDVAKGLDPLPGFSTLGQGYNARTGKFARPLLNLTAAKCLAVTQSGDQKFALPAPLLAHSPDEENSTYSFVRAASEIEQRRKAARLRIEFFAGMFGMDTEVGYDHASSSIEDSFVCSTSTCHALFGAMLPSSRKDIDSYIIDEFQEDVLKLPCLYEKGTSERFYQFFDKWGTHYVQTCDFGGSITVDISISCKLIDKASDIYSAAKVAYFGLCQVAGAAELEAMKQQYGVTTTSDMKMMGGRVTPIPVQGLISKEQRDTWVASLPTAPAKLTETCTLLPVFHLMPDDKYDAIRTAMEQYFGITVRGHAVDPITAKINATKQLIKKHEEDKKETTRRDDAQQIRKKSSDCFDGDTHVVCQSSTGTDHQVQARVADLQVGWKVLAVSSAGQLCWSTVGYIHRHEQPGMVVVIRTAGGRTVRVSPNHLVYVFKPGSSSWTDRCKVPAEQVRVGDSLMVAGAHMLRLDSAGRELCADGMHTQTVVSVVWKAGSQLVYVMNTEGRMVGDGVVQSAHVNFGYYTVLHMYAIRAMWVLSLGSVGALRAMHPLFDACIPVVQLMNKISFCVLGQWLFWLFCVVVRKLVCVVKLVI